MLARLCSILLLLWQILFVSRPVNGIILPTPLSLGQTNGTLENALNATVTTENCFDKSLASRLFPAQHTDCANAVKNILHVAKRNFAFYTFARDGRPAFKLPWTARHGTCIVSLDVVGDEDREYMTPWKVYAAAMGLANVCVNGQNVLGGKLAFEPNNVLVLMVFGRQWPVVKEEIPSKALFLGAPNTSTIDNKESQDRSQSLDTRGLMLQRSDHETLDRPLLLAPREDGPPTLNVSTTELNMSSSPVITSLGGVPTCYDPPMQRERLYPIDISECEKASVQIIGNRDKFDQYIFSRRKMQVPFYFQMPARFSYGRCTVVLDMENDFDIERVRLAYVESSTWVLAHKCSGEEIPEFIYGGSMTVGVGANDLIRIHVYARSAPLPSGNPVLSILGNGTLVESG